MKAAYIEHTGAPSQIRVGDIAEPALVHGSVLVRVKAASVNPIDTYIRSGAVAMNLPKPYIIGSDLAGVVEAIGEGVSGVRVGERVWGSNQGLFGRQGTTSELACVEAHWLYPTPQGVPDEAAAASALVGITAHLGLFRRARLQPGETVLVNGGAGGVGSVVVQMAKAAGARVIAVAGGAANVARCRELGADDAVDYRSEDVAARVKALAPEGVEVLWETRRETDFDWAISLLARRGRMVLMAGREARPQFPVGPFYVKDCELHGFAKFNATPAEQRICADDINRWLAGGRLCANIGRVMPLDLAADAHQLQEDNTLRHAGTLSGKIVLKI